MILSSPFVSSSIFAFSVLFFVISYQNNFEYFRAEVIKTHHADCM